MFGFGRCPTCEKIKRIRGRIFCKECCEKGWSKKSASDDPALALLGLSSIAPMYVPHYSSDSRADYNGGDPRYSYGSDNDV